MKIRKEKVEEQSKKDSEFNFPKNHFQLKLEKLERSFEEELETLINAKSNGDFSENPD
jgi:hypothetical protein